MIPGPEEAPSVRPDRGVQENLEAIVVAIILALLIRHYAMEAFVIPTGSMAPTLAGEHHVIRCPSCQREYGVGKVHDGFRARCQSCGTLVTCPNGQTIPELVMTRDFAYNPSRVHGGNKILVEKLGARFGEVERFDVLVFKYPVEPYRNFIKRIVGLPGERIGIDRGDLFVNGERLRKPPEVQERLWQLVYDQRRPSEAARREPWDEDQPGRWTVRRRGRGTGTLDAELSAQLASEAFIAGPGRGPTRISLRQDIRDAYEYNVERDFETAREATPENYVADVRIRCQALALGDGALSFEILESGQPILVKLPVGGQTLEVERPEDGRVFTTPLSLEQDVPGLEPRRWYDIELAWYDRQLRLVVDGAVWLEWQDAGPKITPEGSRVALIAPEAGGIFQRVVVERDIFYIASGYPSESPERRDIYDSAAGEFVLPEDGFLALGDNQPNSSDGRKWGILRRGHVVGKALAVFWPPSEMRVIR